MGPRRPSQNPFEEDESTWTGRDEEARPTPPAPARVTREQPAVKPRVTGAHPAVPAAPRVTGAHPALPAAPRLTGTTPALQPSARPPPVTAPPRRKDAGAFSSGFDSQDRTKTGARLGTGESPAAAPPRTLSSAEVRALGQRFDGNVAAAAVATTSSDLQPVVAEVSSREGARDPVLARVVLDQFAPEDNPRYSRRETGHIFVWDYANAMGCLVPRYRPSGELTLEQMVTWFRTLSADAGWLKVSTARAAEVASQGYPVVALPRTATKALIAVGRPDGAGPDGAPLLASACQGHWGRRLTTVEAFGEKSADYYFHR